MENFVINIGRQLGSGGRAIGRLLAKELNIGYYDKEILSLAAHGSGLCEEVFEKSDERKGFFRIFSGNVLPFFGGAHGDYRTDTLSEENLFRLQSEAIRKAASEGSCIFIGRCADYVLRDYPRIVNVFVSANTEDRIARICRLDGVDRHEAEKKISRGDNRRAEYYNFYTSGKWGAAETYDFCINSSILGIERTAGLIKEFALEKLSKMK